MLFVYSAICAGLLCFRVAFVFIGQMVIREDTTMCYRPKSCQTEMLNDVKEHTGSTNIQVFTRGQHQHIFQTSNSYSVHLIPPLFRPMRLPENRKAQTGAVADMYELLVTVTIICLFHLHHCLQYASLCFSCENF